MRIGIFGGSFDPVHLGHEALVKEARVKLSLDKVFVVPVWVSPFKIDTPPIASAKERVAMLEVAFGELSWVEILTNEVDRKEVSYTIHTVRGMVQKFPRDQLVLILTEEARPSFPRWKEVGEIQKLVNVAFVGHRSSISATEVRERLQQGLDCKNFLSAKVLDYIEKHRLYSL